MLKSLFAAAAAILLLGGGCAKCCAEEPNSKQNFSKMIDQVAKDELILKGVMITMTEKDMEQLRKDLAKLKEYGVNHVRMNTYPGEGATEEELQELVKRLPSGWDNAQTMFEHTPWVGTSDAIIKRWLPFFEEAGIGVILNLDACFYDVISGNDKEIWRNPELQDKMAKYIAAKAKYFSDSPAVIGYDVINEPVTPGDDAWMEDGLFFGSSWSAEKADKDAPEGSKQLCNLLNKTIKEIRSFDKERLIVVQAGPWMSPAGISQLMGITDDPRVIFSFHHYDPVTFTHNSTRAWHGKDVAQIEKKETYPMTHPNGYVYDRKHLDRLTRCVREFQKDRTALTGRPTVVWIGEFGTVRWIDAQSQRNWYEDFFAMFRENGWGWAYFLYSPGHMAWQCFGAFGDEGETVDVAEWIERYKDGDEAFFKAQNEKGPRPSFQILIDELKKQSAK